MRYCTPTGHIDVEENKEKLTKEFCQEKKLIFFPRTHEEAVTIQQKLIDMGFGWRGERFDEVSTKPANEYHTLTYGLVLHYGLFSVGNNESILTRGCVREYVEATDPNGALLCTVEQLSADYVHAEKVSVDAQEILRQFNKLSAQIAALEKKVDALTLPPRKPRAGKRNPRA